MHALIVGSCGVGKSTLIEKVLRELGRPVTGFVTRKEDALGDSVLGIPVYIYPAGRPRTQSEENLLAYCRGTRPEVYPEAFDRFVPKMRPPQADSVVVMDEIGFMESSSEAFRTMILRQLNGDIPVLAAVKDLDTPFLNEVRSHPNCRRFDITPENRDMLYGEILAFLREQILHG